MAGNHFRDYYPGGAYLDAYGNNYYNTTGIYALHGTTKLYNAFPRKPFMFPEWGLTLDDPEYVKAFATFVRSTGACASRASTTEARAASTTCAGSLEPGRVPSLGRAAVAMMLVCPRHSLRQS